MPLVRLVSPAGCQVHVSGPKPRFSPDFLLFRCNSNAPAPEGRPRRFVQSSVRTQIWYLPEYVAGTLLRVGVLSNGKRRSQRISA